MKPTKVSMKCSKWNRVWFMRHRSRLITKPTATLIRSKRSRQLIISSATLGHKIWSLNRRVSRNGVIRKKLGFTVRPNPTSRRKNKSNHAPKKSCRDWKTLVRSPNLQTSSFSKIGKRPERCLFPKIKTWISALWTTMSLWTSLLHAISTANSTRLILSQSLISRQMVTEWAFLRSQNRRFRHFFQLLTTSRTTPRLNLCPQSK